MLYFESNLTQQEKEARDTMVYLFNPVLKFILMSSNYNEFRKYGFNSCRQTAILGAAYLRKLLPDYELAVYEGSFIEKVNDKFTPYTHAFIIANKGDRHLVIDLSRTTKKLLFSETYINIYPEIEDYENVVKIGQKRLNLDELINTNEPEYFTSKKPRDVLAIIETLIEDLKACPKEVQMSFCRTIYNNTTALGRWVL